MKESRSQESEFSIDFRLWLSVIAASLLVIPAKAGIHKMPERSGFRVSALLRPE